MPRTSAKARQRPRVGGKLKYAVKDYLHEPKRFCKGGGLLRKGQGFYEVLRTHTILILLNIALLQFPPNDGTLGNDMYHDNKQHRDPFRVPNISVCQLFAGHFLGIARR